MAVASGQDPSPGLTALDMPGMLVAILAAWALAGPIGGLVGVVLVALRTVLSPVAVVAAGHVLLLPIVPPGGWAIPEVALFELGMLMLLVTTHYDHWPTIGVLVGSAIAIGGFALAVGSPQWLFAAAVISGFGVLLYLQHRLELVQLGLVEGST